MRPLPFELTFLPLPGLNLVNSPYALQVDPQVMLIND